MEEQLKELLGEFVTIYANVGHKTPDEMQVELYALWLRCVKHLGVDLSGTESRSQSPVEFTGNTLQGDELVEWCDEEVPQHAVVVQREWRGLPDIAFHFGMQSEAHALFLALCQTEAIMVEDEVK